MQIHQLADSTGSHIYYDPNYHVWYESFKPYMDNKLSALNIEPAIAYKYQGDFYGLLDHLSIPKQYHRSVMVVNGLTNSTDYDGEKTVVIVPDYNFLDMLKSLYVTSLKHF